VKKATARLVVLGVLGLVGEAHAEPGSGLAPPIVAPELGDGHATGSFRLSVSVWANPQGVVAAGLSLYIPLDRVARGPAPAEEGPAKAEVSWQKASAEAREAVIREAATEVRVSPEQIRGLLRAAWRAARLSPEEERLGDLASRARASALLPELRLRVLRSNDQALRLTPTDGEDTRVQTSGASSMTYEARATFRLDRLVFADEEVAIERLRVERSQQRLRLTRDVLDAIAAWQRAHGKAIEASIGADERAAAQIQAKAAEALLDGLTDGAWSAREKTTRSEPVAEAPSRGVVASVTRCDERSSSPWGCRWGR
jgi:hypothetical protein